MELQIVKLGAKYAIMDPSTGEFMDKDDPEGESFTLFDNFILKFSTQNQAQEYLSRVTEGEW